MRESTEMNPLEREDWNAQLFDFHRRMVRIRLFENRVGELLESGAIRCPTHLGIGQEAVAAGICAALANDDRVFGNHRSHGHFLAKGGSMNALMAELFGKVTGCSLGRGGSMHLIQLDIGFMGSVPIVSGTIPLAVGAGLASKLNQTQNVTVAFFGDGAMEEGTTHESLNMAASMNLPVIFVCENNFYASHLPLSDRRVEDNLIDSARAHGMAGIRCDGNDVVTVYRAMVEAKTHALLDQGPTFIECRTYRWRGHVGPSWDMDVGVKRRDELKEWMDRDPIAHVERLLRENGAPDHTIELVWAVEQGHVTEAVEFAYNSPFPDPADVANHVWAE
jgi:TPP-dependent pyruvate/acetoin dehydrogenase alpha subunit